MGSYGFGGTNHLSSYTGNWVQSGGIGLPSGRACADGVGHALITSIYGYVAGRGASRNCAMSLGPAATSAFGVGSAGAASSSGWMSASALTAGGSGAFTIDCDGSFYFGRANSGDCYDSEGYHWGGTLGGGVSYVEAPNAPSGIVATPSATTPGAIDLSWTAPTDNGGSAITGYRVEYATNPSFTGASHVDVGTGLSTTITGLTPGTTYYFRIAAKNAVTTAAGTWSVYSGTASALARSGARVWNGAAWVPASVRAWDGSAFQPVLIRVWNGAVFEDAE